MRTLLSALLFILCAPLHNSYAQEKLPASIAFYYNEIDSVRELMNYDRVVVTPSLITEQQLQTLQSSGTLVFAYLSVGEFSGQQLPTSLSQSSPLKNQSWNSHVMDLTSTTWQSYLTQQAKELTAQGFDGLFLDTLDSYMLFAKTPEAQKQQQRAMLTILSALNGGQAQSKLMLNRGFHLIEALAFKPYAVVAESLYHRYNPVSKRYSRSSANDSAWLNQQLDKVQAKNIETIVIDYVPSSKREEQRKAAQRLINENHTPYVSDGLLYEFGVSSVEPVAKRVLGLYDGKQFTRSASPCFQLLATPLEYKGYVPECVDVREMSLSPIDTTKYAAVVFWLEANTFQQVPKLQRWLDSSIGTVPVLFLNALPPYPTTQAKLGIRDDGKLGGQLKQTQGQNWTKGYYPASFSTFETFTAWQARDKSVEPLVTFVDDQDRSSSLVFKAPWGGAALRPFPVTLSANQQPNWSIDPFALIENILNLPVIPAADVTTESGLRVLTSHIDGDGFTAKSWFRGTPYAGQVMYNQIIKPNSLPMTVSVIAEELEPPKAKRQQSQALKRIARNIFTQPNVELASHTYSHPMYWQKSAMASLDNSVNTGSLSARSKAPDAQREIIDSVAFINNQLAPQNKQTKLLLWSGDANPSEQTLNMVHQANLLNVNGGATSIDRTNNDVSRVSPTIRWFPSAVQVYSPIANELSYTNQWTENFDGYKKVIDTFIATGTPRRLKTIGIYHNMYSATYPTSLDALKVVYRWALAQPTTPLHLSEYAQRASQLYETGIAKTLDGAWQVSSSGIKSVRLPNDLGYPHSQQLAGWNQAEDGKYLILKQAKSRFVTSNQSPKGIRLQSANGVLLDWQDKNGTIAWSTQSYLPLKMTISGGKQCQWLSGERLVIRQASSHDVNLSSANSGTLSGTFRCIPLKQDE